MEFIKFSKQGYDDFYEVHSKQEIPSWKNKELDLEKITEVNESEFGSLIDMESVIELPLETSTETQTKSPSKFLVDFLSKLLEHEKVFNFFLFEARKQGVLTKKKSILNSRCLPKIPEFGIYSSQRNSSFINLSIESPAQSISKSSRIISRYVSPFTARSHSKSPQDDASVGRSMITQRKLTSRVTRLRSLSKPKKAVLSSNNKELKELFNTISVSTKNRITQEEFKNYLLLRYPGPIVESMIKFFDFRSTSFEEYIQEMLKFLNAGEDKHLAFSFEIYDFNKDKFICYRDAFRALELRTANFLDEDLVIIKEMLLLKKEGKLNARKLRRKSTFSLIKERIAKKRQDDLQLKDIEILNPIDDQKPVKVDFKEFKIIKFNGRPHIVKDFLKYTCCYDFMKERGLLLPSPKHSPKISESIVMEMNISTEYRTRLEKDEKYEYYCLLDNAMSLYSKLDLELTLKKFRYLQCPDNFKYKVITRESMIEKFSELMGFSSNYFAQRFYDYLAEGQLLTKAKFLSRMHGLISYSSTKAVNKLAFELYDYRKDGKLTVDEVYKMFESLPLGSPVYSECIKMVNIFIDSIFERIWKKVTGIDYAHFEKLIDVSCMGFEIFEFVKTPLEGLFGRKSVYFQPEDEDNRSFHSYLQTKSNLLKLID